MMFDFTCPDHGVFEDLVHSDIGVLPCPKCGKESTRMISAVRLDWRVMGVDSGMPTCSAKWERMQLEKAKRPNSENIIMY